MPDLSHCTAARREVASFMRRLYRQHLTTTSGGNVSCRVGDDLVAITPGSLDKGRLTAAQVAVITLAGATLTPELVISSETKMHLELYAARPDVLAIVHAHPVTASAFTATSTPIDCTLLAETYALIGRPAFAPYALTGTLELARIVADCARSADVVLLENHGLVALGRTLLQAYDRLELIESAAKMTLITHQLGTARPLSVARQRELDVLMRRPPLA